MYIQLDPHDTSRVVKTASRKVRRSRLKMADGTLGPRRVGKNFRPIYHHGIPVKESHKAIIKAMMAKDRKAAYHYANEVNIGLALGLWGFALRGCAQRQDMARMKLRHDAMKAAGTWIERNVKFGY